MLSEYIFDIYCVYRVAHLLKPACLSSITARKYSHYIARINPENALKLMLAGVINNRWECPVGGSGSSPMRLPRPHRHCSEICRRALGEPTNSDAELAISSQVGLVADCSSRSKFTESFVAGLKRPLIRTDSRLPAAESSIYKTSRNNIIYVVE